MKNLRNTQEKVTIGDSSSVTATGRGTASLVTSEGHKLDLDECLYIPEFDRNICSLGRFAKKGHDIEMTLPWIKVWSKNKKQSLDFKRDGDLYYLTASKRQGHEGSTNIAMQALQKGETVNVNLAHALLGHPGKALFDQFLSWLDGN